MHERLGDELRTRRALHFAHKARALAAEHEALAATHDSMVHRGGMAVEVALFPGN